MTRVRLSEPASDWVGHTLESRLRHCARALFIHGEITRDEWQRISAAIGTRSIGERRLIRRERSPWWRSKGALLIYVALSGVIVWTFAGWAVLG